LIANDLRAWMKRHKTTSVLPGVVIRTTAGSLEKYRVKFVLHVAAVHATSGRGYHPVVDVRGCVREVLRRLDEQKADFPSERASVLIPLSGTGAGGARTEDVAPQLLTAAIEYLEETADSIVGRALFLIYSEQQWNTCTKVLDKLMHRLRRAPEDGVET
jgi:O-acetyl-ADP-ribose deacetylase (regulator of RNase III)